MRATVRIEDSGFTLIELLVAISLLAIGLLASAAMQSVAINADSIANRMTAMASLGQEVLEDVMSLPRNDPRLTTGSTIPIQAISNENIPGAGTFNASYTVTINTPITNVSKIDITVQRVDSSAGGIFKISNSDYTLTCFKRVQP